MLTRAARRERSRGYGGFVGVAGGVVCADGEAGVLGAVGVLGLLGADEPVESKPLTVSVRLTDPLAQVSVITTL